MRKPPSYTLHKASGQAVVRLNGRDFYLGKFDSPESRERYHRLIADWEADGRRLPIPSQVAEVANLETVSIVEMIAAYSRHCDEYYRKADGLPTSTVAMVRPALRRLRKLYGLVKVTEFRPLALQSVRQSWITDGLSRRTINAYTDVVCRMFKWGVAREMVAETVYRALTTVPALVCGRSAAREPDPKRPVLEPHIMAVQPYVSRQVWALVQLQLATAGRGGELVILRPIDFDTSDSVWVTTLPDHKTAHLGREKVLYFGPQAQAIVRKFMVDRPIDAYLFSPREAEAERRAACLTHRRPNQCPSSPKTGRRLGDRYSSASYRRAIERACKLAGVPHWHPHRLRHNTATKIRREAGIEAARIVLGHASGDMTELYAERDRDQAIRVMQRIG